MDTYECDKYITTKENILNTLNNFGVAIIPSILDDIECNNMIDGLWDFFEYITQKWDIPINRNNEESWSLFKNLAPQKSMIFQHWNIAHAQFVWDLRQNRKIIDIFSTIWNDDDLLVSFDCSAFLPPPEITNYGWNDKTWYHTDQSFLNNNFSCVQSWITPINVNIGDATLSIMEYSHKYHEEFSEEFNIKNKSDWYELSKEQEHWYLNKNCNYKKIYCPKGSLVLWDSKLIHCGTSPFIERLYPNFRIVSYLCYMPKKLCNDNIINKRIKAFETLRTTTHYVTKFRLFPKTPESYVDEIPIITEINKPILNDNGYKLIGY